MNKKISAIFTALSVGSFVWMGYGYFTKPEGVTPAATSTAQAASASTSSSAATAQAPGSTTVDGVTLREVDPGEAFGLMLLGAQYKDKLATLTDPRDLCTVVKGNAILNNSKLGDRRFSTEFETCADRTLHYEAALMQAGSIIGTENISKMTEADFCGVNRLSVGRAMMKYALEAGQAIPDHDSTLETINMHLEDCAAKGAYGLSDQLWNDYANQALILPFYKSKGPAPSR